jgi:hypothetical protein
MNPAPPVTKSIPVDGATTAPVHWRDLMRAKGADFKRSQANLEHKHLTLLAYYRIIAGKFEGRSGCNIYGADPKLQSACAGEPNSIEEFIEYVDVPPCRHHAVNLVVRTLWLTTHPL